VFLGRDRANLESSAGCGGYSGASRQTQPGSGRVPLAVSAYQRVKHAFAIHWSVALVVVDHPQDRTVFSAMARHVDDRREARPTVED
jgi:hypothetical protein